MQLPAPRLPIGGAWIDAAEREAIPVDQNTGETFGAFARGKKAGDVDGGRQLRVARRLHAGQIFVNNYWAAGGVESPFGGVGKPGHGREKGFEAMYGFASLKTVAIKYE